MVRTLAAFLVCLLSLALAPQEAWAEFEFSAYGGIQTSPHSVVEGNDPGGIGEFDFTAGWEGRSLEVPPYWGIRGLWWPGGERLGYGLEFTHAKVYADDETLEDNGFDTLEFTDGLNILTVKVFRRWLNENRRWTPYVGGGVGVSIPYVEVETSGGETFEYQLTGPAVSWTAGVTYEINNRWEVFGEYSGSYSQNEADLDNGGELETNIVTNALNIGVSFNF